MPPHSEESKEEALALRPVIMPIRRAPPPRPTSDDDHRSGPTAHNRGFDIKAVARLSTSTSSLSERFSRRNRVELLPLLAGQAGTFTLVDLILFDPGAHVGLGQIEVLGHLADAAITAPAQLDDLSFEL